jgi:tRNA threonylcarbamoyladenosine biosynthesis protein TsaE
MTMFDEFHLTLPTEATQLSFGGDLAKICGDGTVIALVGELGAGKTTLVRGFLQQLGYVGRVKSPTYALVENYELGTHKIFHFDLYRLKDPVELEVIGIRDYFDGHAIILIEWFDRAHQRLPVPDIVCSFQIMKEGRNIYCKALTENGRQIIKKFSSDQRFR